MPQRSPYIRPTAATFADRMQAETADFLRQLDREAGAALLLDLNQRMLAELDRIRTLEALRAVLIEEIDCTSDYSRLREIEEKLTHLEVERFEAAQSVPGLHHSCTEYRDLLADRTLQLVEQELQATHGVAPCPMALISMGSDGREEQTLITDQDYLLVYGDDGGETADDYFRSFSELLVERLAEVGFKKCTGDIMPSNPIWRGSVHQWNRRLLAIVRYEFEDYAKNLMDLIVLSDARFVGGDRMLGDSLIELIREFEQNYFQVIWGMAKAATEMQVGLGWFKRIWTERSGEFKGLFNVKLLGWAPLVMNVRILAVNLGIPATSTLQRLELLEQAKSLSPTSTAGLCEAYHVLTRHRIRLQIRCLRGEFASSYYLDPKQLSSAETDELRQALLQIEDLQKIIHSNFSIL